jgi:hypothetical protein
VLAHFKILPPHFSGRLRKVMRNLKSNWSLVLYPSLHLPQHKLMPAEQMKEFDGTTLVIRYPRIQNFLPANISRKFLFLSVLQKQICNVYMLTCRAVILPATIGSTINPPLCR